jgi:hypothetical protein
MASLNPTEGLSSAGQGPVEVIDTPGLDGNMPVLTQAMASLTASNTYQGAAKGINENITDLGSARLTPDNGNTEASANALDASDMQVAALQAHVAPIVPMQTTPILDTTDASAPMSQRVSHSENMPVVIPETQLSSLDTCWGDETITSWE